MAGPAASYVQLPSDTSNTGKKNRTQTKVVGSDTVHEHFVVPSPAYTKVARHYYQSTAASAVSATSGGQLLVLQLTTTATVNAVIRKLTVNYSQSGAAVISQTAPMFIVSKCTFNGAMSGTTETSLPYNTTATAAQMNIRTTSSGGTLGTFKQFSGFMLPALVSTSGTYGGSQNIVDAEGENYQRGSALELTAGEALVIWQQDAATASDTRKLNFRIVFDEIDLS